METKGLNSNQGRTVPLPQRSNEIEKTAGIFIPILLDDPYRFEALHDYVLKNKRSDEELMNLILEQYDDCNYEDLENMIITLCGFRIIANENQITSAYELDQYFEEIQQKRKITEAERNDFRE